MFVVSSLKHSTLNGFKNPYKAIFQWQKTHSHIGGGKKQAQHTKKFKELFFLLFPFEKFLGTVKKILISLHHTSFCFSSVFQLYLCKLILLQVSFLYISIISSTILYSIWINYARVTMHEFPFFLNFFSSFPHAWHRHRLSEACIALSWHTQRDREDKES